MSEEPDVPARTDLVARAILLFFSAGLGLLAQYFFAPGPGVGFWALTFSSLLLLAAATIAPRRVRLAIVNFMHWF